MVNLSKRSLCLTSLTLEVEECAKVKLISIKIKSAITNRPWDFAQVQLLVCEKQGLGKWLHSHFQFWRAQLCIARWAFWISQGPINMARHGNQSRASDNLWPSRLQHLLQKILTSSHAEPYVNNWLQMHSLGHLHSISTLPPSWPTTNLSPAEMPGNSCQLSLLLCLPL